MKLHLGCGERYLEGYRNIDFPPSRHSVQRKTVADELADILTLRFPAGTIEEVRLHHVFEHFPRPAAMALVACWNSWLQPEGRIHLEVPDTQRQMQVLLDPSSNLHDRLLSIRHVFGSHEADWAYHYEGYTPGNLQFLLEAYGFEIIRLEKNGWMGTHNFEIVGRKTRLGLSQSDFETITQQVLSQYLLDDSRSELSLLAVWMTEYRKQVERSWCREGSIPG
jgi:hypothetical protein